jgi:hypothetical protein
VQNKEGDDLKMAKDTVRDLHQIAEGRSMLRNFVCHHMWTSTDATLAIERRDEPTQGQFANNLGRRLGMMECSVCKSTTEFTAVPNRTGGESIVSGLPETYKAANRPPSMPGLQLYIQMPASRLTATRRQRDTLGAKMQVVLMVRGSGIRERFCNFYNMTV